MTRDQGETILTLADEFEELKVSVFVECLTDACSNIAAPCGSCRKLFAQIDALKDAALSRLQGQERTDWRSIVLALWGDPEDCADCLDLSERPCAVHANIEIGRRLATGAGEETT